MTTPANVFDYIVVGGGTSGLVVAARLVEDPTVSVCVLEAGGDISSDLNTIVPGITHSLVCRHLVLTATNAGFGFKNFVNPEVGWGFESTPQRNAEGRSLSLPR
jgi:choline dehydrogenase-like flavoprotein